MSVYDYLTFGNVLSFDVYPSAIIGASFKDVTVLAILDKDSAKVWIDPDAMHVNVYPTLPPGVPDNPNQYQYAKLKHTNGNISIVGIPWIRADTVVVSDAGTLIVTIPNVGPVDRERIVRAITANGYRASKVELV